MAIYRSDQASVTFGAEAAQGAYPEYADIGGSPTDTNLGHLAITAGDKTVTLSAALTTSVLSGGANLKCLIIIGNHGTVAGRPNTGPKEVRRVVGGFGSTTITVDAPFAFNHIATTSDASDNSVYAKVIAADGSADSLTDDNAGKFATWLPGIYESVDCPDPEQAFEPRYILGGLTNRNFYQMYAGQETLTGSLAGMVMLNGFPLRFAMGKVVTVPVTASTTSRQLQGTANKGDITVNIKSQSGAWAAGDYMVFGNNTSTCPNDEFYTNGGTQRPDGDTLNYEVRQIMEAIPSAGQNEIVSLNYPLQFGHKLNDYVFKIAAAGVTAGTERFKHTILEAVVLPSLTWNVSVLDDSGSNIWQRRYIGGKVGNMTLGAEQGGLLTGGWEGVNFLDMLHNQKTHPNMPANQPMPRYAAMQEITTSNVGRPTYSSSSSDGYRSFTRPTTSPYYFSQGTLKMFDSTTDASSGGTAIKEVGRLLNFSISMGNTAEPRYYVGQQYDGRRGPKEIFEGQREYSMSATVATDDSVNNETSDTTNVFKELLLAGDYRTTAGGFKGFGLNLKFIRDSGEGTSNDTMEIDIPDDATANIGGNEQGAFIRSATHNIGDDAPIQADLDIAFRSMTIKIEDYEPIYP
jgi:hypothetical protein